MLRPMSLLVGFFTTLICFAMTLTACAPYRPDSARAGACNELNSRMIFSGSTSNIQKAEIQEASLPLEQRTYDRNCDS